MHLKGLSVCLAQFEEVQLMNRNEVLKNIKDCGVVSIVRGTSAAALGNISSALQKGGLKAIEVTFNTPGAAKMIEELVDKYANGMIVGAGTVLDPETARVAILSGASFVLTPTLNLKVIEVCHRYGVLVVPGAMTPTEALTAWEAGVQLVKIFPAGSLGPNYLKDLRGPLPQIDMVPVGGVNLNNAAAFIKAGAAALGVGGELVDKELIAQGRWEDLAARAAMFVQTVAEARASR